MAGDQCTWTIDTLKEHFEKLLEAQEQNNKAHFEAIQLQTSMSLKSAEQAVLKAESSAEKRFESVNEFRNTLSDQQRNLMPRSEVAVVAGALTDKIEGMRSALDSKMNGLEKQLDAIKNEAVGVRGGWGYAVGVIGFVLSIGSLILIGMRFLASSPNP